MDNVKREKNFEFKWCCIRPKLCKSSYNWKFVYVFLCISCFAQNLVASGIATVIISTLEKEFYMTSTASGFFLSSYDLAAFIASPIIGYLSGLATMNKMRLLSINLLLISSGAYLIGLTIFMKEPDRSIYTSYFKNEIGSSHLCLLNKTYSECPNQDMEQSKIFLKHIQVVLYIGNIIIGFGSVAMYTTGVALIEEIATPSKSALSQAIFYGIGSIGGGAGILLTSQFLNLNSRFYTKSFKKLTYLNTNHTNWIGCWWMPWLIYGFVCNLVALIIYGFPAKVINPEKEKEIGEAESKREENAMPKASENAATEPEENLRRLQKIKKQLKNFFKAFKKLNMRSILLACASATEGILLKGFLGFISKYFEYQFGMTASVSNYVMSVIALVSVIFGTIGGAQLISRLKWDGKKCSLFITVVYFVTSLSFWFLNLSCEQLKFENTSVCDSDCPCEKKFSPVCLKYDTDVYVFQSPCHAGCSKSADSIYSNCTCLPNNLSLTNLTLTLSANNCDKSIRCFGNMIVGVCIAFFIVFLTAFALIPHLKAFLGSIDIGQQSFALGIRSAIIRIIGNFVGPIIFGVAIDSTCVFWKTNCYDQKVCKLYDNKSMSLSLSTIGFCVRFSTSLLTLISYILYARSGKHIVGNNEAPSINAVENENSDCADKNNEASKTNSNEIDSAIKVKELISNELCESRLTFSEPQENEAKENPEELADKFQLYKTLSIPNEMQPETNSNVLSCGKLSESAINALLLDSNSTIDTHKF